MNFRPAQALGWRDQRPWQERMPRSPALRWLGQTSGGCASETATSTHSRHRRSAARFPRAAPIESCQPFELGRRAQRFSIRFPLQASPPICQTQRKKGQEVENSKQDKTVTPPLPKVDALMTQQDDPRNIRHGRPRCGNVQRVAEHGVIVGEIMALRTQSDELQRNVYGDGQSVDRPSAQCGTRGTRSGLTAATIRFADDPRRSRRPAADPQALPYLDETAVDEIPRGLHVTAFGPSAE